jgi:TolB protein
VPAVKGLTIIVAVLLTAVVATAATSTRRVLPGHNGRIVFASRRAVLGQPGADYRNGEIYSLDLASGHRRDLSRSPDFDWSPALSPDGRRIAFVRGSHSGENALWLMRRDGRSQRRLAELGRIGLPEYGALGWSPNGATIAFNAAGPPASAGFWVVNVDGSGLRRLTRFYAGSPRWSPDGSEIAFAGSDDAAPAHLGLINADGTGLRWLTRAGNNATDIEPAWSPDGTRIAFARTTGLVSCCETVNLFLIGADGGGERQLTGYDSSAPIPVNAPAWSPNGRQIVFLRGGTNDGAVNLIRPDGAGLRTIGRHGLAPAAWSPTGDRLAFGQLVPRKSGPWGLALTLEPLRGRARRYQLDHSSFLQGGPLWSPGGNSLVYASSSSENDLELFSVTPRAAGLRQLTRDRVDDFDPAWSPDGRRIVFARGKIDPDSGRIRRSSLYLMDANGRHLRPLTRGTLDTGPSWVPNGKRIVFARNHGLELLDLRTGRVHSLGVDTDSAPAWSPHGRLIAFGLGSELKAIRPDGKGERTLFYGGNQGGGITTEIFRPSWSPHGDSLAFHLRYDHGRWSEDSDVIVSRSGHTQRTLSCPVPWPPPSEPEYSDEVRLAWSPDGLWVAADGVAVCRADGSTASWLTPGIEPDWQARVR